MNFICFNGKILPASEPVITTRNRGYKWGDGVFETMKVYKGNILLEDLHFERLFLSLEMLLIETKFQVETLREVILRLCGKNNCTELSRVRLAVYRDEGGQSAYTIEALPLMDVCNKWNSQGLKITVYPIARKATDAFANLKSASFLPYVMASLYAEKNGWDDVLVLNSNNDIADSSRANLFIFKKGELLTPSLDQGCVNGVMRRFVLDHCKKQGIVVHQQKIEEAELLEADEAFLTNAIQGIRWVKQFKGKEFGFERTQSIYEQLFSKDFPK